ncbi:hypothetical protein ACQP3D_29840, partial [Escherichia coli]
MYVNFSYCFSLLNTKSPLCPCADVPVCKPVELCSKSQSFGKETDASFNYDPPATTFGFELKESGNEVI